MRKALISCALLAASCSGRGEVIPTPAPGPTTAPEPQPIKMEATVTTEAEVVTTTTEPAPTTMEYVAPVTTMRRTTTSLHVQATTRTAGVVTTSDIWWQLALCESGGSNVDTGNGYSGYFQFLDSTWRSVGYSGRAVDYGYETQMAGAQILQARSGWGQWPSCAYQLGLL